MLFLCSIVSLSLVMYSGDDAVSMFNCVPFTCDVFWWWCCFYVQLCPFHLWCILVMKLCLCSIVSLSLVMYSGDDAVSMFNCVPFTCDVFWWWCCFYVQLCPFHLWCILVIMLFLCSIVSLSLVMYNCVPFICEVYLVMMLFLCSIVSLHLWCILVMMLFLCSIVSLSFVMYSSDDAVSMFNCVPFTCDVFWWWCCFYVQLCPFHLWCILWWCCFYVQLCPFHLWCILVMMLFLCSIVSLSLVMYSGDDAVSMFNCVPFTCDVFCDDAVSMFNCVPFTCDVFLWWCCFYVQLCPFHLWCILVICCFYVQLCPFHLWCILVMMLFLCPIVSLSLVMYSDDAVSMFNCVPFTCDVFWWWCCFYVQLCPFHLWCILVMMLFLCSIVSLSLVMYSGDDAVSMFNCVPFTCDVFWWWCCFYVQLCPFHLWCILVMMLFLCSIVSLSLVMYSGDDAVSMFNCVPSTCDVF